jgi:sec-independent protein translocase protein TatA
MERQMPNIGLPEIAIVLIIVLVIFGPKRLPDLGRSLGRGMREFKDSVTGKDKDELELPAGESSTDTAARAETSDGEPAPAVTAPDKRP